MWYLVDRGAGFMTESTDHLTFKGEQRTVFDCTNCSKAIIALLDYSITGNHVVECPHCGHEHCRVITDGKITGDRWDTRHGDDKTRDAKRPRRIWKHNVLQAEASSASEFIRQRWMERYYR
jgi:DNA-directed RNA polymerase subunit RPC12/RpoP